MNGDSFATLLLSLALILMAAKAGGHLAVRIGQPAVLGELGAGVLLGNLALVGFSGFDYLKTDASVDLLSRIGAILLLFQVGLESTVAEMVKVGLSSFLVASLGTIGSLVLGWGVATWLLPDASPFTCLFIGATLTATSVGITARVFTDLGRTDSREARVILGAAVIDDVMGLLILAILTGVADANSQGGLSYAAVGGILAKAGFFLLGALTLGVYLSARLFSLASKLEASGALLATGLVVCFLLSWLSTVFGLAPIIGAFSAGLILEDVHYRDFVKRGEHTLSELVDPIASFLVPIFFVLMGARADLGTLARPGVLTLAVALTLAAIAGKQLCAAGVLDEGVNRLAVGIGMVPRGEVELIMANMGLTLTVAGRPVIDQGIFSAVVITVIATTVMTPPALKWSFERRLRAQGSRLREGVGPKS
jgi:Kef-type K+ transport system membrane component KefB